MGNYLHQAYALFNLILLMEPFKTEAFNKQAQEYPKTIDMLKEEV